MSSNDQLKLDQIIELRNQIQILAERRGQEVSDRIWTEMGVCNRHIERVYSGVMTLNQAQLEMLRCLDRATAILEAEMRKELPGK